MLVSPSTVPPESITLKNKKDDNSVTKCIIEDLFTYLLLLSTLQLSPQQQSPHSQNNNTPNRPQITSVFKFREYGLVFELPQYSVILNGSRNNLFQCDFGALFPGHATVNDDKIPLLEINQVNALDITMLLMRLERCYVIYFFHIHIYFYAHFIVVYGFYHFF